MKKKILIIAIIIVSVLIVAGVVLLIVFKPGSKVNPPKNETPVNDPTLGEEDGYYVPVENTTEGIHETSCNEELCVVINTISFLGENGGMILTIYPNEKFNKEQNQSGYIKLRFNNACEKNTIILDYDFKASKKIEKEVALTCKDYLETEKYFISTPSPEEIEDYTKKYNPEH